MMQRKKSPFRDFFIVLKNKIINRIFVKGVNGFPLQAICFPVGERRAASSAPLLLKARLSSLSHGSQVASTPNLLARVFATHFIEEGCK